MPDSHEEHLPRLTVREYSEMVQMIVRNHLALSPSLAPDVKRRVFACLGACSDVSTEDLAVISAKKGFPV